MDEAELSDPLHGPPCRWASSLSSPGYSWCDETERASGLLKVPQLECRTVDPTVLRLCFLPFLSNPALPLPTFPFSPFPILQSFPWPISFIFLLSNYAQTSLEMHMRRRNSHMNFHIQAYCPVSLRAHCLGSLRAQIWEHQPYLGPCTSAVGEGLGQ